MAATSHSCHLSTRNTDTGSRTAEVMVTCTRLEGRCTRCPDAKVAPREDGWDVAPAMRAHEPPGSGGAAAPARWGNHEPRRERSWPLRGAAAGTRPGRRRRRGEIGPTQRGAERTRCCGAAAPSASAASGLDARRTRCSTANAAAAGRGRRRARRRRSWTTGSG